MESWLFAILLATAAFPAAAVPISPVPTDMAGFVGLAAQGPLDQAILVESYAEFVAVFGRAKRSSGSSGA